METKPTEEEIMQHLAKNPLKTMQKLKETAKVLNGCRRCTALVRMNPKRDFEDYCDSCKTKLKPIWE